jgi:signal transduction histidine kinase
VLTGIAVLWLVVPACVLFVYVVNNRLVDVGHAELGQDFAAGGIAIVMAMVASASVGALLVAQQPRHPVGWLLLILGVVMAVGTAGTSYATWGAVVRPGSLPAADAVGVLADSSWIAWFVILALVLHLTPSGKPLSKRWEAVAWLTGASGLVWWSSVFTRPLHPPLDAVANPLAVWPNSHVIVAATQVAGWCTAVGLVLAGVSVVLRFRRSQGTERRQLLWLAVAAVPLPVLIAGAFVGSAVDSPVLVGVASGGMVLLLPVATGLSVVRYHLYDVDRILSRAATYLVVSALLALSYATVVFATSRALGSLAGRSEGTIVVATLTAVAIAAPAYRRVQDGLDRRFNRRRYEALRMARDYARRPDPGLTVEDMLGQALGQPVVQVGYWMQDRGVWATAVGEPITARDDDVVVERHDRPVARIRLSGSAIEKDLASAIALEAASEFDNARLRVEAAAQLRDVRQSRQRLTRVQLAERRRIGRDLHDGAQQRLLALGLQLRSALNSDDHRRLSVAIEYGIAEVRTATEELRDLANGLHPSVLTDSGLFAALDDLSARSVIRIDVRGEERRFPQEIETTGWFIACEAISNVVKHSDATRVDIEISAHRGRFRIRIDDDGTGNANPAGRGISGIRDRAEALGGSLNVTATERGGTSVRAELPCAS